MAKTEKKTNQVNLLGVYEYLSHELQQARDALMNEVRIASAQISSLHGDLKDSSEKSTAAVSQEIRFSYKQNQTIYDGLASMLTKEVAERLNSMEASLAALEKLQFILDDLNELKYAYMNLQAVCDTTQAMVVNEVNPKLDVLAMQQQLLEEINNKLVALPSEEDYNRMVETVATKAEETAQTYANQVVETIAALPTAENVDYSRIVEEVGDKVLDLLQQMKGEEVEPALPAEVKIDYDRIICGAAEKVVESLPYPEKFDYERLADMVAAKLAAPAVDYDRIADMVIEKMAATTEKVCEVTLDEAGIDELATKVADKIIPTEAIDYDKVCQAAQAAQILPDPVDYDRIAEIVEDKLNAEEPTYDLVIDEEGIAALAKGVSEELCQMCVPCECVPVEAAPVEEAPVEEPVIETVEETPVEEPVDVAEETFPTEEAPVEEAAPVEEELAVAVSGYQEVGDDLIDAETGLVIRLKRSFTAKMKQSDEKVKGYYSDIKNELTSYKKVNSNVSWHGDRFNFGRDTVAKINICGKTLCFYLDLDPNDPELKPTVYHQKDVGAQKAYESTPFMVKVKSDAAAKKALRLVGYLAEKLGTEKDEDFEAVDYAGEFAYASTKQLFDEGFIKATKEKKVDLNF